MVPKSDYSLVDIDLTFGLKQYVPGLGYLLTIEGPPAFFRGFVYGTQVTAD